MQRVPDSEPVVSAADWDIGHGGEDGGEDEDEDGRSGLRILDIMVYNDDGRGWEL